MTDTNHSSPKPIWISRTPEYGLEEHDTLEEAAQRAAPETDGEWHEDAEDAAVLVAFEVLEARRQTMPPFGGYDECCDLFMGLSDEIVQSGRYKAPLPPAHEPRVVYYLNGEGETEPCVVVRESIREGYSVVVFVNRARFTAICDVANDRLFHQPKGEAP